MDFIICILLAGILHQLIRIHTRLQDANASSKWGTELLGKILHRLLEEQ